MVIVYLIIFWSNIEFESFHTTTTHILKGFNSNSIMLGKKLVHFIYYCSERSSFFISSVEPVLDRMWLSYRWCLYQLCYWPTSQPAVSEPFSIYCHKKARPFSYITILSVLIKWSCFFGNSWLKLRPGRSSFLGCPLHHRSRPNSQQKNK